MLPRQMQVQRALSKVIFPNNQSDVACYQPLHGEAPVGTADPNRFQFIAFLI